MPPRPKFTKDEVLAAALAVVEAEGEDALTARRLGQELGSSPRPIFTLFDGMADLKKQLHDGPAMQAFSSFCEDYLAQADTDDPMPFKRVGYCLVSFATERPMLFAFLFISGGSGTATLQEWGDTPQAESSLEILMSAYSLDRQTAQLVFAETWLHTFSLCVLRVTGAAQVSDEEVSLSLSRAFQGLMLLARAGKLVNPSSPGDGQSL